MTDKELIQELRSKAEVEGAGSTRRLLELAARALERVQWVSVKDRLPETNDEVLTTYVYTEKPGKRYVEAASYFDDGEGEGHWHSVWDEYRVGNARKTVIAWMPMPRPYKPEVSGDA